MEDTIKKAVQVDDKVFILNGDDELIMIYEAVELAKHYFQLDNDSFFNLYGFNYVPEGIYYQMAQAELEKQMR